MSTNTEKYSLEAKRTTSVQSGKILESEETVDIT